MERQRLEKFSQTSHRAVFHGRAGKQKDEISWACRGATWRAYPRGKGNWQEIYIYIYIDPMTGVRGIFNKRFPSNDEDLINPSAGIKPGTVPRLGSIVGPRLILMTPFNPFGRLPSPLDGYQKWFRGPAWVTATGRHKSFCNASRISAFNQHLFRSFVFAILSHLCLYG